MGFGQSWAIGRGDGCEVLLDGNSVSRLHALIQRRERGHYYLVDLGSRNGSFVNGKRVSFPVRLGHKDRLAFGEQELIFHDAAPRNPSAHPVEINPRDLPTDILRTQTTVTIVVVDLRDFTVLAQSLPEERLSRTIGTWFLRLGQITSKHGSWAQRYIGDAVMAVWTHANPDQLESALAPVFQAVCDIRDATDEVSQYFHVSPSLRIGVGINTGPAVIEGSDNIAIGNTVNAAFRLETATKSIGLDIAVGEGVYAAFRDAAPPHFRRFEVPLKGYEGPCAVWGISFEDLHQFVSSQMRPGGSQVAPEYVP